MPKGSKLIHPRKVHVIVGPPIVVPGADRAACRGPSSPR